MVLRGQRDVKCEHVAGRDQVVEISTFDVRWRGRERVVGEHPHTEGRGKFADSPPDAAVADDADGGAVQIAGWATRCAFGPATFPDERRVRTQPFGQMKGVSEHSFGYGPGAAPWREDAGDASCGRCFQVHQAAAAP